MNKITIIFISSILISLFSNVNSSSNSERLENIEKRQIENDKFLKQFITFFDKRIMWLEENFNGINANYTSCCIDTKKNKRILFILQTLVNDHLNIKDNFYYKNEFEF